jgi:hypothetical protein
MFDDQVEYAEDNPSGCDDMGNCTLEGSDGLDCCDEFDDYDEDEEEID